MKWVLKGIEQETDHRFLNFFTFTYSVEKDGEESSFPYYVSSRRKKEELVALTGDRTRSDGVLIAAIKDGEEPSLLLIEEFRPAMNAWIVGFPAGLMDPEDEDEGVTAKREAEEEAGVLIEDVRLLCPASPTSAGLSDELVAVVEGKVVGLTEKHLERFEDIRARFVPFKDLQAVLDGPNLIALNVRLSMLYLLERYRRERA